MAKLKNVHPGEVLLEEFLVPMKLSQNALARAIGVPPRRINEIVLGKRSITADRRERWIAGEAPALLAGRWGWVLTVRRTCSATQECAGKKHRCLTKSLFSLFVLNRQIGVISLARF